MSVFAVFSQIDASRVGEAIRDSNWLFAAIEAFHLLGLATIGGAVLLVDLRLLGFGLKPEPLHCSRAKSALT